VADSVAQQDPHHNPHHLAPGAVTPFGDVIAAITNVAPSTSVALSLGAIIAVSGLAAPSVVVIVGLLMLCIAVSYHYLNLWAPSAAAQAMWIARSVRPVVGLAIGFIVILMTLVSNIGNITLFGPYFLGIVWPSQANNALLQWLVTAIATGLVLYIAIEGIKRAIRFQTIVVWVEYAIIIAFIIGLLAAEFSGHAGTTTPQASWLLPSSAPSFSGLTAGIVIGVFMYGGWEAAVYLAEEGTDVKKNPGRAGIISVVFCIVWLTTLAVAIQGIAPQAELVANAGNIIAYSASVIWPTWAVDVVSLAVLSSVVAVTQSQLNNFSRMSFGLSREGLLPIWIGTLNRHRTPGRALILSAAIPVVLLIAYLGSTSAGSAIGLISGTAGLMYIVMYVAGAATCIWFYRRTLLRSAKQFIVAGLLPLIGGAGLVFAAYKALPTLPNGTLYPFIVMFVVVWPAAWIVKLARRHRSSICGWSRRVLRSQGGRLPGCSLQVQLMARLTGKRVLVTGGARGIGRGIATGFVAEGAHVVVMDVIAPVGNEQLEAETPEWLSRVLHVTGDVSDEASVFESVSEATSWMGGIDILVCCAGVVSESPVHELDPREWDRVLNINLRGVFLCARAVLPQMLAQREGRIINVASQLGQIGGDQMAHYSASKAGVIGFTKALAREVAPYNVLVNAIAPGPIETDMLASESEEWVRRKLQDLPMRRFGKIEEVVPTAIFLATDEASYYTGQTLGPNGGDVML